MKKIFAIAWKDAIIRFTSIWELLFFIVLPVVFTFLLAGGTPSGNGDPRLELFVVDEAKTTISQQIIAELKAVQGQPADIGGYYLVDAAKCNAVMRPSATFNAALAAALA